MLALDGVDARFVALSVEGLDLVDVCDLERAFGDVVLEAALNFEVVQSVCELPDLKFDDFAVG